MVIVSFFQLFDNHDYILELALFLIIIHALYKGGDCSQIDNYKGITVGPVLAKVFAMILLHRSETRMPPQPALVWPLHSRPRETAECFGGWRTTNVGTASWSLASVCRRLNSHVTHSCWIAEATGCLTSLLLWALVDCECQENQGRCVWSTQVYVSGFSIWGQSYRAIIFFQVFRYWATWHKRYANCNTSVSNVREKGSFCIVTQMCRVPHLWPNITMLVVWYTSQTSA